MSKAPEVCLYCDREGNSSAGGRCGFCDAGKPLDTQEDWDKSWGRLFERWKHTEECIHPQCDDEICQRFRELKRS